MDRSICRMQARDVAMWVPLADNRRKKREL